MKLRHNKACIDRFESAKRVDFDRLDRLKRAQRLTDGLRNKDPTSQYRSETAQPGDDYCCNTSGASEFFFALLSAGNNLNW